MASGASSSFGEHGEGWDEIEGFVAGVSQLAQSEISLAEFAGQTLQSTVPLLEAISGSLWMASAETDLRLIKRHDPQGIETGMPDASKGFHTRFMQSVIHSGQSQLSGPEEGGRFQWIAAPVRMNNEVVGLIEVMQPLGISAAGLSGNERLLTMVSELTGEHLRRQQLTDLRASALQWQQFESLSQRAHASLDLDETAYQLANDGRRFVDVDRVSLMVPAGGRFKTVAISGMDTVDPRSQLVQAMEELAEPVAQSRQWLRYRGDTDSLPPQLEAPVLRLADESHTQLIDVIPLLAPAGQEAVSPDEVVAVLIAERFDAVKTPGMDERLTRLATLSSVAIRNALDYQTLPMLSMSRWLRRTARRGQNGKRKLLFAGITLAGVATLLAIIPAPLSIEAEGQAQPGIRRNLFAPMDGDIVQVMTEHDQDVDRGQTVIRLRSRDLEIELQRLQGEYQTIEKKLLAIASARVQDDRRAPQDRRNRDSRFPGQLAAEEAELKQQLESIRRQLELVRKQRERLSVESPISGRILTWDPDELLTDRPVQRGQLLLSVADVNGPWEVDLKVSDRRIGRLLQAADQSETPLPVTFTLINDRTRILNGTVSQIAGRTEGSAEGMATARVTVAVDSEGAETLRAGSTVHAKIDCGDRALGYVWFHDIYDTVRGWLLF